MKTIFFIAACITGLECYALSLGMNGVMFSAAVGGLSAIVGGVVGYLKGKKNYGQTQKRTSG